MLNDLDKIMCSNAVIVFLCFIHLLIIFGWIGLSNHFKIKLNNLFKMIN